MLKDHSDIVSTLLVNTNLCVSVTSGKVFICIHNTLIILTFIWVQNNCHNAQSPPLLRKEMVGIYCEHYFAFPCYVAGLDTC